MLDLRFIRENPDKVRAAMHTKHMWMDLDALLWYDKSVRYYNEEAEELRSLRNELSHKVPKLKGEERSAIIETVKEIKKELAWLDERIEFNNKQLRYYMLRVPNIPLDCVPEGDYDGDNLVLRYWSKDTGTLVINEDVV